MDKELNPTMQWHSGQYASDAMKEPHVTLLDHFAGQIMNGFLSAQVAQISGGKVFDETDAKYFASQSYLMAKAMLAERQRILEESEVTNG